MQYIFDSLVILFALERKGLIISIAVTVLLSLFLLFVYITAFENDSSSNEPLDFKCLVLGFFVFLGFTLPFWHLGITHHNDAKTYAFLKEKRGMTTKEYISLVKKETQQYEESLRESSLRWQMEEDEKKLRQLEKRFDLSSEN